MVPTVTRGGIRYINYSAIWLISSTIGMIDASAVTMVVVIQFIENHTNIPFGRFY